MGSLTALELWPEPNGGWSPAIGMGFGSSVGRAGEVCGSAGLVPGTPSPARHQPSPQLCPFRTRGRPVCGCFEESFQIEAGGREKE